MDRGAAMLAVVLEVYEGGKDLIPGWKLKEQAESAFGTGGVEGLRRYYEACLTGLGHHVTTTLERDRRKTLQSEREPFMSIYLGAARRVGCPQGWWLPRSDTFSGRLRGGDARDV